MRLWYLRLATRSMISAAQSDVSCATCENSHKTISLKTVIATSHARSKQLNAGDILWHAQLGHCWREEEREDGSVKGRIAYGPKRMKPIPEKVLDGRANPKGIVCLYLATDKKTACSKRGHLLAPMSPLLSSRFSEIYN